MDKIQRITKESAKIYKLWLESGRTVLVSEDILISFHLHKELELTSEQIKKIEEASKFDYGYQQALNYLSYQLRSEKEIFDYLKGKELSLTDRNQIILRLKELKLLDDLVYAESYVRTSMRTSDKGPLAIERQLTKKGIKSDLITTSLLLYIKEEQERVALQAARKMGNRYRSRSYKEMLQKIQLNLFQKGFSKEIISSVMEQLDFEKDEDQEYFLLHKQAEKIWERNHKLEKKKRMLKVKQNLFQKGFDYELIQQYLNEKEYEDE